MLEVKNLHVTVDGKQILKGLDLTVSKGEVHAIMGPNGSGKSTLAYVMAGKPGYEATEGQILLDGEDILAMRGLRLIAASHHCQLSHIAEPVRGEGQEELVQRGLPLLKKSIARTAGLYAFFTALHQHAQAQGEEHTLLWWETGNRCEHHYSDHGERHTLRPDATFAYKAKDARLFAWLEWEEVATSKSDLATKLREYAHFAKVREWLAAGFQTLLVLCIIVPERSHLRHLAPVVSEQLAGTELLARMTTAQLVAERGPLAAIWWQLAPAATAQDAVQSPPRTLLDLGNSVSLMKSSSRKTR